MTNNNLIAVSMADRWAGFWEGNIGTWILDVYLKADGKDLDAQAEPSSTAAAPAAG